MENGFETSTAPEPAPPGFAAGFSAAARIYFAPSTVFQQIKTGLSWWPGLILMVVIGLIITGVSMPLQMEAMRMQMESGEMPGLEEDGGEGVIGTAVTVTSYLGVLFGVPIMMLIVAFFYWLALTVTFGGVAYGRIFCLTVYTSFVSLLFQVLNVIYLRLSAPEFSDAKELQAAALNFSLAAFLEDAEGFLYGFLGRFGLFEFWEIFLFVGGAALILGRRRGQVVWPVVVIFLLGAVIAGGIASLGARFG